PQGGSAALACDPDLPPDELLLAMSEAAKNVHTGQITLAARDSDFDGQEIKEGQILAMNEDKLSFVGSDVNSAALKLTGDIAKADEASFITVFYGDDVKEEKAQALASSITERFSGAEVNLINGGQPVYSYIISVEC
ncbi:MAG: DAK2 domain-containing protein, partial [Clostridia bacterium]|nr:DAK2 domain-containing protein [Clostridia bacterium]